MFEGFAEKLSFRDVDCNEFQDTILGDNADYHGSFGLIVDIYEWYPTSPRFEHTAASFVKWTKGVDGDRLQRSNPNRLLNV